MADSQNDQQIIFPLGQHIEVLQRRAALRGSWQPATIITVRKGRRGIEYDEGSGLEGLRESFSVMKDSEKSSIYWLQRFGKKGFLRPLPPQLRDEAQKTWSKGLLVDAFDKGAWWEGVLLEDADTVSCVKVLFPDRDDECAVLVKNLRVSQQWDVFTGLWNVRGYWKGISSSGDAKDTSYREIQSPIPKPLKCVAHRSQLALEDASPGLSNKEERASTNKFKELVNEKRSTARDYLFKMGYTVEFHQRIGRGREGVYIDPNGRRFYSLTMACKAWKKQHNMPNNHATCTSQEERLLSIYDIFEVPSCLDSNCSKSMEIKAVENSSFNEMQRAIVPFVEPHSLQDPQVTQSGGIMNSRDNGPSCNQVEHKRGRKRHLEKMLEESHATQSHIITTGNVLSSEPKKRCGHKPCLEKMLEESYTTQGHLTTTGIVLSSESRKRRGRKPHIQKILEESHTMQSHLTITSNILSSELNRRHRHKPHVEEMLKESHTTQSHLTTASTILSSEPKKRRGHKPHFAENHMNEVLPNSGEKKKPKCGCKSCLDGKLPLLEGTTSNVRLKAKHGRKPCLNLCTNKHRVVISNSNRGRRGRKPLFVRDSCSSTSKGERKTSRISFLPVLDKCSTNKGKEAFDGFQKDLHHDKDSHSPVSTITEAMLSPGASSSNCNEVNLQVEGTGKVDDICSACGDGGDLVLCDHCPSTYHAECAGLEAIPEGDWYCFSCCCASCEGFLFDTDYSPPPVACKQCEKKYHVNCLPSEGRHVNDILAKDFWFCGMSCEQIHIGLHRQIGVSYPLETGGLSWMLLRFNQEESCISNSKLLAALIVLQECFVPMIDVSTGVDIISQALYSKGSEMVRLNCLGFYTLILERGCELISVATFRIHGSRLAEMPFIGTRFHQRRKGMCRQLVCVLEKILVEVGVRNLLLPAVPQLLRTWRSKFGFLHINSRDRMEIMRMNLMQFPGTTLLKKNVIKSCFNPHVCCNSIQSIDLPSNAQERGSLSCDGKSIGGGNELESFKRSRNKVGQTELDSGDARVIIATTKFKRLVRSPQWYVDSMKELSHDAELLRNKERSRIMVPWEKRHEKFFAVSEKTRRRGRPPGTLKLRLNTKKPDHTIGDQVPAMVVCHDQVSGVPVVDCELSTLLNTEDPLTIAICYDQGSGVPAIDCDLLTLLHTQDPPTCAKFYTRRKAIDKSSGSKSIPGQSFIDALAQSEASEEH